MVDEESTKKPTQDDSSEKKSKFVFKCTRCGDCCVRGDIPLTFWDIELWAKNKVVANMFPHLAVVSPRKGMMDLVIKSVPSEEKTAEEKKETNEGADATKVSDDKKDTSETANVSNEGTTEENKKEMRCPLYRPSDKTCLIYENRPIYCREFPLEYEGNAFSLFEEPDCPGVGQGTMTKEELQQIRDNAKFCSGELRRIRISLPILHQIVSQNTLQLFLEQLARDSEERMKNLSEEDRKKMDDISRKMEGRGAENAK
ncbi:MAG: hypothetical protein RBG13Loki_2397 [Promethearchaeota archaeon CR_4]|nr:MAG: hypothetical protein RBG13Loki_2397 [Candidatus Lokiarchaeota archaeon CR_4]